MRIRELRIAAGLTVQAVADAVGVKCPSVTAWEHGRAYPTADKLPKIAAVLGCKISDLYPDN